MADNLSSTDRRKAMQAVKSSQTTPERQIRGILAGLHISGWKINWEKLPGKPDFVFPEKKIVLFVDGCFWHGCESCNRSNPKTNSDYWKKKINANIARDKKNNVQLASEGWMVLRIWEHQLKKEQRKNLRVFLKDNLCHNKL